MWILGLVAAGCSGDEEETFDCSDDDISGLYFMDWTYVDGTCSRDDGLLPLANGPDEPGCAVAQDRDDCRVTEVTECDDGRGWALVLDQLDDDGDELKGTITYSAPGVCSGTHTFRATRQ